MVSADHNRINNSKELQKLEKDDCSCIHFALHTPSSHVPHAFMHDRKMEGDGRATWKRKQSKAHRVAKKLIFYWTLQVCLFRYIWYSPLHRLLHIRKQCKITIRQNSKGCLVWKIWNGKSEKGKKERKKKFQKFCLVRIWIGKMLVFNPQTSSFSSINLVNNLPSIFYLH